MEINNIWNMIKFNLKTNKKSLIGWSAAIFLATTLYIILFPSMNEVASLELKSMPEELLSFIGMESFADLSDWTTYFSMMFALLITVVSIFAAIFSSSLINKEEKTGSMEFLNSLSVSRGEIYLSKFLTSLIGIVLVAGTCLGTGIMCGVINGGDTFDLMKVVMAGKIAIFVPFFFGGVAFFLSSCSKKLGSAVFGSGIVIVSYMIGYLGDLLEDKGKFLLNFSPFNKFSIIKVTDMNNDLWILLLGYGIIYIILIILGKIFFQKRDLNL